MPAVSANTVMCLPAANVVGRCESIAATTAPSPPVRGNAAASEPRRATFFTGKKNYNVVLI